MTEIPWSREATDRLERYLDVMPEGLAVIWEQQEHEKYGAVVSDARRPRIQEYGAVVSDARRPRIQEGAVFIVHATADIAMRRAEDLAREEAEARGSIVANVEVELRHIAHALHQSVLQLRVAAEKMDEALAAEEGGAHG